MKHALLHYRQRYNPAERMWEMLDDKRKVVGASVERYPAAIKEITYEPNHRGVHIAWEGILSVS